MNSDDLKTIESQRQALLGQLIAAEAALNASLEPGCASVTARTHLKRALAHVQEAMVAIQEVRKARTVWQFLKDLEKGRHQLNDLQPEPPVCHSKKSQSI